MGTKVLHGDMDKLPTVNEDETSEICGARQRSPQNLRRRKTWPRLVPCLSDIIYWDDGAAEEIGEGFFSKVYKFAHRPSEYVVVVKVTKDDSQATEEDQAVMMKEIKLLKKLSHENIIKYLGLCAKDGKFHPVLEYINGGGLDRLLVNSNISLSWSEKIGFCRDIAKGMQYLHSNHVFHRDLKSPNCLIRHGENGSRTAVVADFGLAREVTGDTRTPRKMSVVGTGYWMAPELLNGKVYNSKVDVFSYGIVCCEILARVISEPDDLPRTSNFGLDLEKFLEICPGCPEQMTELVQDCTEVNNAFARPSFDAIVNRLEEIECGHDDADYDVIEEILWSMESEDDSEVVTKQFVRRLSDESDQCVRNSNSPQRHSGISDDSGFGEFCSNCRANGLASKPITSETNLVTSETAQKSKKEKFGHIRKKVSFKFVTSLLSGRRRFKENVIHEDVAPSRGLSLKRSASLPELKDPSPERRERSLTTTDGRNERPRSMYYENVFY